MLDASILACRRKSEKASLTSKDLNPAEFWRYSLEIYSNRAVKDICLELQDDFGADVNLLLLSLWLAELGLTVDTHGFSGLLNLSNRWQTSVLHPLRTERRAQKRENTSYKLALTKELDAEKDEQTALIAYANFHLADINTTDTPNTGLLNQYAAVLHLPRQPLLELQELVRDFQ